MFSKEDLDAYVQHYKPIKVNVFKDPEVVANKVIVYDLVILDTLAKTNSENRFVGRITGSIVTKEANAETILQSLSLKHADEINSLRRDYNKNQKCALKVEELKIILGTSYSYPIVD